MTEQGAGPDNGIAVEPREAQRPTSLAARTPQAATPGNGDLAVGAIKTGPRQARSGASQAPWRLPALHPLVSRETEKREDGPARAPEVKARGDDACPWRAVARIPSEGGSAGLFDKVNPE